MATTPPGAVLHAAFLHYEALGSVYGSWLVGVRLGQGDRVLQAGLLWVSQLCRFEISEERRQENETSKTKQ